MVDGMTELRLLRDLCGEPIPVLFPVGIGYLSNSPLVGRQASNLIQPNGKIGEWIGVESLVNFVVHIIFNSVLPELGLIPVIR